jgi:two-component system NtrC family sensor kinase
MPSRFEDRFLHLYQQVTRLLTSTLDVSEVLQLIVREVPSTVGVDAATIRLLDNSRKKLTLLAAHGLSQAYLARGPLDDEKSVTTALAGRPVAIWDATQDPRIHYPQEARAEGVRSLLVVPIRFGSETKGVLRLLTRSPRHFTQAEIDFCTAIAEQCGIALHNATAYDLQHRQLEFFKTLHQIGKALNASLQRDEVLRLIVSKLPEVMDLKGSTLRLLDAGNKHLELAAASGLSERYLNRGAIDGELSTLTALKGEPMQIYDAANDSRNPFCEAACAEGIGSILAVPILAKNRIIGVLRLLTARKRHFSDVEIQFAMAVAEQSGIAILNATHYQKITALVAELEHHEEFLQRILDALKADLFVVDPQGRVLMVNQTFLTNHHCVEDAVIGRPLDAVLRFGPVTALMREQLQHHAQSMTHIRQIPAADEPCHLEIMATAVALDQSSQKIDYIIGTLQDVTALVHLKAARREEERLQGVLEMAGAAAHELNNPLAIIRQLAELMHKGPHDAAQQAEDLHAIIRNVDRMARLIAKMTSITRYKAKPYVGDTHIIDIEAASSQNNRRQPGNSR